MIGDAHRAHSPYDGERPGKGDKGDKDDAET